MALFISLTDPVRLWQGQQGVPGALSLEDAEEDAAQASRNWTIV